MATHNKFLILIITLGLAIGLFNKPDSQRENKTAWNIQQLADGRIHVLGITPGKTTIQEADQILGHFAEPRLYNTEPARLLATHEHIMSGKDTARIELEYQLDELDLAALQQSVTVFSPCQYDKPTTEQEIALLSTPIAKIIYTPTTQYTTRSIKRYLGDADSIEQKNPEQQIMHYRKLNLTVYINRDKPDVLVYHDTLQVKHK